MKNPIEELGFIKEKIENGLVYSNFAYKTDEKEIEELKTKFPKDCELFLYSDYLDDTKESEYRCAVVINTDNKTVVFANAGTRPKPNMKGFYDLLDDAKLSTGYLPNKLKPAGRLNDIIIDSIECFGGDIGSWKFDYTGHSLGAVMANVAAADMAVKLKDKEVLKPGSISCIGFDNPGAKKLVEQIYTTKHLNPEQALKDINYININNSKNFINTVNDQIGETYQLVKDGQKEPNLISQFIGYLSGKLSFFIPPIVKKLCNILSYGDLYKQVSEHDISNFVEVIHNQNGRIKTPEGVTVTLDSAINKDYIIPYDKALANYAEDRRKLIKPNKEMDFFMKNDNGKEFLISKEEIIAAGKNRIHIPDPILKKINKSNNMQL